MDQKELIDVVILLKITIYEVDFTIYDFNNLKYAYCVWQDPKASPPGIEYHPQLASFHELASVNKLVGVFNASLSFVLLT